MEASASREGKKRIMFEIGVVFFVTILVRMGAMYGLSWLGKIGIIGDSTVRLILNQLILALPAVIYLTIRTKHPLRELHFCKIRISTVILLIVLTYTMIPVLGFLNSLSMLFTKNLIQETMQATVDEGSLVFAVTTIALIPAILEETVYRGFFFHQYRRVNAGRAAILSAFLFGLMHLNANQFIYAFALGFLLAVLNEATGSIWASVIVHFVLNASSTVLMYLLPRLMKMLEKIAQIEGVELDMNTEVQQQMSSGKELLPIIGFYGVISIGAIFLGYLLLKTIAKNEGRMDAVRSMFRSQNETEGERILSIPLLLGIVICIAVIIYVQFHIM